MHISQQYEMALVVQTNEPVERQYSPMEVAAIKRCKSSRRPRRIKALKLPWSAAQANWFVNRYL